MSDGTYKLLMIIGRYYPDVGGTERACQEMARKLRGMGYDITILTEYREGLPGHEIIKGIPVYRYIKGWHIFEITYMLSVLSFLVKHRHQIDGILCYGLYLFTAPAVLFCRCAGKRIFFRLGSARETGDFHRIAQLKYGRFILGCAKKAHGAIAMTMEIEAELLRYGFLTDKILRIPNGVDTETFSPPSSKPEKPFVICYVGRLTEGKGLDTIIKAVCTLKEHTTAFKVFIVGDGELKSSLSEQVERYGLTEFASFTGEVDSAVSYYRQSHVFVLPSLSEGMPLALLEAMACGTAAIASNVGGIPDVIGDFQQKQLEGYWICGHGILVPPGNSNILAAALLRLLRDEKLLKTFAERGRKKVCEKHSLDNITQRYMRLFTEK